MGCLALVFGWLIAVIAIANELLRFSSTCGSGECFELQLITLPDLCGEADGITVPFVATAHIDSPSYFSVTLDDASFSVALQGAGVVVATTNSSISSVIRFEPSGTQDLHKELEQTISDFFGTDDTILYTSCFDANGGLFETLLGPEDAVISDALNHASIIDGIRLCKAQRHRYPNSDMAALEQALKDTQAGRRPSEQACLRSSDSGVQPGAHV